jgi:hypothetical protein
MRVLAGGALLAGTATVPTAEGAAGPVPRTRPAGTRRVRVAQCDTRGTSADHEALSIASDVHVDSSSTVDEGGSPDLARPGAGFDTGAGERK